MGEYVVNPESLKKLFKHAFHISINMNDTFYYASGDASDLSTEDIEDFLPTFEKYGFDALIAYEAIKRGHDPQIPPNLTEEFYAAKKELIEKLDADENFMSELNDEYREHKAEIAEFGGRLYYKWIKPTWWQKNIKNQYYQTCVIHVEGKDIKASGRNMSEAKENLRKLYGKR